MQAQGGGTIGTLIGGGLAQNPKAEGTQPFIPTSATNPNLFINFLNQKAANPSPELEAILGQTAQLR